MNPVCFSFAVIFVVYLHVGLPLLACSVQGDVGGFENRPPGTAVA